MCILEFSISPIPTKTVKLLEISLFENIFRSLRAQPCAGESMSLEPSLEPVSGGGNNLPDVVLQLGFLQVFYYGVLCGDAGKGLRFVLLCQTMKTRITASVSADGAHSSY